ncbi:putative metallophosphoesterase At3g03305 [Phalaenopsis equestris]|uniref:putative metallophosphoesterase At3g03305 n=1 Tax=Phalaenopsis equestris TaxID=78828 RepID=UPI0009E26732|nr:putative metallophosphoesterase At3g03305 [Phalaenopsis equestris]
MPHLWIFDVPSQRCLLDRSVEDCRRAMAVAACSFFFLLLIQTSVSSASLDRRRTIVEVEGGPDGVVWVVQLSDLHFSVFHSERAVDFKRFIGPALSMINPALVLITGDLTDGKSKDLLTMKQEEAEWIEYQNVTEDVIMRSGLDKKVFYDVRGNHDSFGVPDFGGEYDFYSKYSINARLKRDGNVQSVTLQYKGWKHLFVGVDSFMEIGLRGPTNLFGHLTDELLSDLDKELGQWDARSTESITKISFGHFPLSFTATTVTGKNIKDVFLKHSLSAYLCGHLHTRFGKNLKRHHVESTGTYYQLNMHQGNPSYKNNENCSANAEFSKEFWEWEIGDWRRSRSMRIVAIDSGHVSFLDLDYHLGSKDTIILPTFPLDSRFMHRISSPRDFQCLSKEISSFETVRTLIFSRRVIVSVSLKIYDSRSGHFHLVLDQEMIKLKANETRGDMYVAPWNWRAFIDPSPDRFLLQIVATDISGKYTYSQPRPFSINGLTAYANWNWKEFFVLGVQWAALYQPLLHFLLTLLFTLLLIPQTFLIFSKNHTTYNNNNRAGSEEKSFSACFVDTGIFVLVELCRMTEIWWGILLYLLYLVFFPWFFGHVSTEDGKLSYMTQRGWSVSPSKSGSQNVYIGVPDIMVIVLPHLGFVVLPTVLVLGAIVAEARAYRAHLHSLSGKKEDDHYKERKRYVKFRSFSDAFGIWSRRWIRKLLFIICLLILWKHWKQCRALVKAYDMNPFVHSPVYCFWIPLSLAYTIYRTSAHVK